MSRIFRNRSLTELHTMRLDASANFFAEVTSIEMLADALKEAERLGIPAAILGGGSNTLFELNVTSAIIKLNLRGTKTIVENDEGAIVRVAASENWHDFVKHMVENGLYGLENLALIPGTVGASPIQNIGAYGVEVSQSIVKLGVYDREHHRICELSSFDCGLAYRDSYFKTRWNARYVIIWVEFKLSRVPNLCLSYFPKVERERLNTPLDVFNYVVETRSNKLPDPVYIPNSGSFFKNPVVPNNDAERILRIHPDAPHWQQDKGVKFAAAWLIDHLGFKGRSLEGGITPYYKQALVLTNKASATYDQLFNAQCTLVTAVEDAFGITLEREPVLVR